MNLAIVGSRTFNDYSLFCDSIESLRCKVNITSFVSGGAKGADRLAERYADEFSFPITVHLPDWDGLGKGAGYARNITIVNECDILIAFWDGQSKGTKHSIQLALKSGKLVLIINYTNL